MKLNTFLAVIAVTMTSALFSMQQRSPLPGWRVTTSAIPVMIKHPLVPSQRFPVVVYHGHYNCETRKRSAETQTR